MGLVVEEEEHRESSGGLVVPLFLLAGSVDIYSLLG